MKNLILFSLVILGIYHANAEPLDPSDCKCRLDVSSRIVGGVESRAAIPWMVSLGMEQWDGSVDHFCGGFILNHDHVITSAHCIEQFKDPSSLSKLHVRASMQFLNEAEKYLQIFPAEKTVVDLRYDSSNPSDQVGDIGIIRIAGSFVFNKLVQPACLPKEFEHYDDRIGSLQAVGWGSIRRVLRSINDGSKTTPVLSNVLKTALFNYMNPEGGDDHLIKVEPVRSGESICVGDNGGPVMHNKDGYTRVVGISQYIQGYTDGEYQVFCYGPAGLARLSYYQNIIESVVGKDYCTY